jgi:large repetitive protein
MIRIIRTLTAAAARAGFYFFVLSVLCGISAQPSDAALFFLSDRNSTASFETETQANHFSWNVDGRQYLKGGVNPGQAFWYRIGDAGPEQSVHTTLPVLAQGATDTNFNGNPETLFVRYGNAALQIDTSYRLNGGLAGSGTSDLTEQISISNLTASPMDFHFFQYADFDLPGPGGDNAVFTNANTVDQFKGAFQLTETVVTPVPSHREVAFFPATLNKLNNAGPDDLNDLPPIGVALGPGDVTWAYQWDVVIPPSSTYLISKDKHITGPQVPEPAAFVLLTIGLGLLLHKRRTR